MGSRFVVSMVLAVGGFLFSSVTLEAQSISITSVSPQTFTLNPGSTQCVAVTISRTNYTGSLTITTTSTIPAGVTRTVTNPGTGNSGQICMAAGTSVQTGTFTINFTVSGTGVTSRQSSFTMTIQQAAAITITGATPSTLTVNPGQSGSVSVTISRTSYTGSVSLSATGLPSGVTTTSSGPGTTNSGTITFNAGTSVQTGSFTVTIRATGTGATTGTRNISLTIAPSGSISITGASPSSLSLNPGQSGTVNVTISRSNYTGSVSLSATGLPSGVTTSSSGPGTGNSGSITFSAGTSVGIGTFTVTIRATGTGASTGTRDITLTITQSGAITISSVSPSSLAINPGQSGTVSVTISRTNFTGSVSLSATNLPSGVTTSSSNPGTGNSGSITFIAGTSVATGSFTVTIRATGTGASTGTRDYSLTISQPAAIAITGASPSSLTLNPNQSGSVSVTIARTNYTGSVSLSATGLPAGVTTSSSGPGTGSSGTITFIAGSSVQTGTFTVTIRATGTGASTGTRDISLTIAQPGSIAITSATPSLVSLNTNQSGTVNVTIARTNFTGSVSLSATGLPAGVTTSSSNPGTTNSGSITFIAGSSVQTGTFTVTIHATGTGASSGTSNITLQISQPAAIAITSVSPPSLALDPGASGTVTVNISRTNYTGSVSLSVLGLPSGVTATPSGPGTSNSGTIGFSAAGGTTSGTYNLTIQASGTSVSTVTSGFQLTINTQQPASLTVTVQQLDGSIPANASTLCKVVRYPGAQSTTCNSSGQVVYTNLTPGAQYDFEAYYEGASAFDSLGELWATATRTVNSGSNALTMRRDWPYAETLRVFRVSDNAELTSTSQVAANTQIRLEAQVRNATGSSRSTRVQFRLDRDKAAGYDLDVYTSYVSIAANATYTFSTTYTVPQSATYHKAVKTEVQGSGKTDAWDWAQAFVGQANGDLTVTVQTHTGGVPVEASTRCKVVRYPAGSGTSIDTEPCNNSGQVIYTGIAPGTVYDFEAYYEGVNAFDTLGELWATATRTVNSGSNALTMRRDWPYAETLRVFRVSDNAELTSTSQVAANTQIRLEAQVRNATGSSRSTRVQFRLDHDRTAGYDLDVYTSYVSIAANSTYTFSTTYTVPQSATYHYAVKTEVQGSGKTDAWDWAQAFVGGGAADPPVIGTTVIIHGQQIFDACIPYWTYTMGKEIRARAGGGRILWYDGESGHFVNPCGATECFTKKPDEDWCSASSSGETILLFDWAAETGPFFWYPGFSEAAAEALVAALIRGNAEGHFTLSPIHVIAHSRGTVVASEAVERLLALRMSFGLGIDVDHVTYLDPHPTLTGDVFLNSGYSPDPGEVVAWAGITYVDNYFQWVEYPQGRSIEGTENHNLSLRLNRLFDLSGFYPTAEHAEVHAWYHGTIDTQATSDGDGIDIVAWKWYENLSRSNIGFFYTRLGGGKGQRVGPQGQRTVVNFDFASPREGIVNGHFNRGLSPGWLLHGGGGDGRMALTLGALVLEDDHLVLRHNRVYFPPNVKQLRFRMSVEKADSKPAPGSDRLEILVGDTVVGYTYLTYEHSPDVSSVDISQFAGTVNTFAFRLKPGGAAAEAKVTIDDVRFGLSSEPTAPSPIAPSDGASLSALTPTFVWSAFVPGTGGHPSAGYQLRVRSDSEADRVVYDTGFVAAASTTSHVYSAGGYSGFDSVSGVERVSEALQYGKHYHWHVRYRDTSGAWTPWSADVFDQHQDFYTVQSGVRSIAIDQTMFNVSTVTGNAAPPVTFQVWNSGTGSLAYSVSSNAAWVTPTPPSGTSSGEQQPITLNFNSSLPAGTYSASISINATDAANSPVTIPVAFKIEAAPSITVTPSSLAFGNVAVGSALTQSFTVRNSGGGILTGTASTTSPFALISGHSYKLAEGESQEVLVRFAPPAVQAYSTTVTFTGGEGTTRIVSGSGIDQPNPVIAVAPTVIDFGSVVVAGSGHAGVTIQNSGTGTLTGTATTSGAFSVESGGSYSLSPGMITTVLVRFSPVNEGSFSGTLTLTGGGGATVNLSGTGTGSVGTPVISVSPSSLDFGSTEVGASSELSFFVSNVGSGTLAGSVATVPPFGVTAESSYALSAGESRPVTIRFSPSVDGPVSADVTFTGGGGISLVVSGVGAPPPTLTVFKSGDGAGTVSSSPSGIDCGSDCSSKFKFASTVFLAATPATGSVFLGWSGAGCSGSGGCVIEMSQSHSVTATFAALSPPSGDDALLGRGGDFNGDGRTDMTWRNQQIYETHVWMMNGTVLAGGAVMPFAGSDWKRLAVGDLNGDGNSDLIWRHVSGEVHVWFMSGTSLAGGAVLPGVGPDWTLAAVGDFNGDGKDDLVWSHTSGETHLWLMNGGAIAAGAVLPVNANQWRLALTGDFNGDGRDDLLLRNRTSYDTHLWFMNGASIAGGAVLPYAGADWKPAAAGDFNGDGRADVIWRHTPSGEGHLWFMNGGTIAGGTVLPGLSNDWKLVHQGDYDGDGKDDLVWRYVTGEAHMWLMNGGAIKSGAVLPGISSVWTTIREGDKGMVPDTETVLLSESFGRSTLPDGWNLTSGSATVNGEFMTLSYGCVELPGLFSRETGLRIEADVDVRWAGFGDFNLYTLFDAVPDCHLGPNPNGYYAGFYPKTGDNVHDVFYNIAGGVNAGGTQVPASLTSQRWNRVVLELGSDGSVRTFVDGVLTLETVENTHASGKIALRSWGDVFIDNLVVTKGIQASSAMDN